MCHLILLRTPSNPLGAGISDSRPFATNAKGRGTHYVVMSARSKACATRPGAPFLAFFARSGAFRWLCAEVEVIRPCISCEGGRRFAGLFVCHATRPALQQRRTIRTLGYRRLLSMLARSLLLEAKSPTSRKEREKWGTHAPTSDFGAFLNPQPALCRIFSFHQVQSLIRTNPASPYA